MLGRWHVAHRCTVRCLWILWILWIGLQVLPKLMSSWDSPYMRYVDREGGSMTIHDPQKLKQTDSMFQETMSRICLYCFRLCQGLIRFSKEHRNFYFKATRLWDLEFASATRIWWLWWMWESNQRQLNQFNLVAASVRSVKGSSQARPYLEPKAPPHLVVMRLWRDTLFFYVILFYLNCSVCLWHFVTISQLATLSATQILTRDNLVLNFWDSAVQLGVSFSIKALQFLPVLSVLSWSRWASASFC